LGQHHINCKITPMAASFAEAAKEPAMRSVILAMLMLAAVQAKSQDPLKVDPGHFKVEFENDQVRVVRVHFDPHYKSTMNQVPPRVVILLTDEHIRVTFPDGTSADRHLKAGTAFWTERGQGRPENLSDLPFELIWVVPKTVPPPNPAGAATAEFR
jgi:hypothetical protein